MTIFAVCRLDDYSWARPLQMTHIVDPAPAISFNKYAE